MLSTKIVKQEHDEKEYLKQLEGGMQQGVGEKLGHGTKVCLDLLDPWRNAPGTRRVVCADSYFALVATCIELYKHNFNFIGVIKNATKQFPMEYLKGLELGRRGEKSLLSHLMNINVPCYWPFSG